MRTETKMQYSYRADPGVPAFDDSHPMTVMDGECVLCTVGARLIARFDKLVYYRITYIENWPGIAIDSLVVQICAASPIRRYVRG